MDNKVDECAKDKLRRKEPLADFGGTILVERSIVYLRVFTLALKPIVTRASSVKIF